MALVPVSARNQVNPLPLTTTEEHELCTDPNCPYFRPQGRHRHHRKHYTYALPTAPARVESAASTVSIHSINFDDGRSNVSERALVPVNKSERQMISTTTKNQRVPKDEVVRNAWTKQRTPDDEIICCRAYDGCRCPCWFCIIFLVLIIILIIILIVLLATLL